MQQLHLNNNQLSGSIPEGWRLPDSLQVCMGAAPLAVLLMIHAARVRCWLFLFWVEQLFP